MSTFDDCLAFTLREEGGAVSNSHDPGGFTFRGVTLSTFRWWLDDPSATSEDLLAISDDDLAALYGALYWNPISGDALPPAIAMMTFDFGVNAGTRKSAVTLQKAIGATEDGSIGPLTLASVAAANLTSVVGLLAALRRDFYRACKAYPTFGRGWLARTDRCEAAAMALLPSVVVPPSSPGA